MKNYSGSEIKSMKSVIKVVLFTIVFGMGSIAFAQQGGGAGNNGGKSGPGERFDRALTLLVDSVGINEAQAVKVKAVNSKYEKTFTEARDEMQNGGDREQMREKFRSIMTEYDKEITAILTDEQNVKYKAMKQERMNQRKKQNANGQGRPARGGK